MIGAVAFALPLAVGPAAPPPPTPAPPDVARDFVASQPAVAPNPALAALLASLRTEALAAHVGFLASPALGGRGLGTQGLEAAAEYAAASLALAGVPPLPGTSPAYTQPVPLRELHDTTGQVEVRGLVGGSGFRTMTFSSPADCRLPTVPSRTIDGRAVFAGYGIREPALGRDDLAAVELRGAVALVLDGLPPGAAWQTDSMRERYASPKPGERHDAKLDALREAGAAAVLVVEPDGWPRRDADEPSFLPPGWSASDAPLVRVSPALADALLASAGLGHVSAASARPQVLPATVTVRVATEERPFTSRNVIGWLQGSDPARREEAVVIGAHLDHLGSPGGVLHPGADDDASGVAALLEIARAFASAAPRPRCSVVFCFWTGEEEGKLGSGQWVRTPLWPLERTVAYLNLDMIGHPWSREEIAKLVDDVHLAHGDEFLAHVRPADFAEPGVADWAPDLAEMVARAGPLAGLALHLDRTDGRHGGSDYRDFARAKVPFVRFFGNFFPGYHEPGDTTEALDPAQVHRVARLCLATAWLLAER